MNCVDYVMERARIKIARKAYEEHYNTHTRSTIPLFPHDRNANMSFETRARTRVHLLEMRAIGAAGCCVM